MNNATFAGRLGKDAVTRDVGDTTATGFSLAVDEYAGKGERKTLWIDCTLWGQRGESVEEYLVKGTPVAVAGRIGVRTYEKDGETHAALTLRVNELTLLGSKRDDDKPQQEAPRRPTREQPPTRKPARSDEPFPDDDIPF